jgi:hypothetical protein
LPCGIIGDPGGRVRASATVSAPLRAHFSIAYAATYLKEEVQAESLTRNLEGFARFLGVAAEWAGHHLGLANLASAA